MNKLLIIVLISLSSSYLNEAAVSNNVNVLKYLQEAEESLSSSRIKTLSNRKNQIDREALRFRGIGDAETANLNKYATISLKAVKSMAEDNKWSANEIPNVLSGTVIPKEFCPIKPSNCDKTERYRSIDGSCNNLLKPWYGKSNTPFVRLSKPTYDDGISEPRMLGLYHDVLPNPRAVAAKVLYPRDDVPEIEDRNHEWNNLFAIMLQFTIHDSSLSAATTKGYDGEEMLSCNCLTKDPECLIIPTPRGDELNYDQACMATARTAHTFSDNECKFSHRQQINANTAYYDLSTVYGSTLEASKRLRQFYGGLLRYIEISDEKGEYLPVFDENGKFKDGIFIAGDVRVNANLVLQSIHTLYLREHNRLARSLAYINPHWDDERLYQEARRINIAQYQKVVFHELVNQIIGGLARQLGITPTITEGGEYDNVYNETVNAQLSNEFATAAFRFGHSLVGGTSNYCLKNDRHIKLMDLREALHPELADYREDGFRRLLTGAVVDEMSEIDAHITSALFNFLEEVPSKSDYPPHDGSFQRISVGTFNLERGRDHGIPTYLEMRKYCFPDAEPIKNFDDLAKNNIMNEADAINLKMTYKYVEDIDLYAGGLCEMTGFPVAGNLFSCIIGEQFLRSKIGDRFYYENGGTEATKYTEFTNEQLAEIRKTSFSGLICTHVKPDTIGPDAFRLKNFQNRFRFNEEKKCSEFENISFEPWIETIPKDFYQSQEKKYVDENKYSHEDRYDDKYDHSREDRYDDKYDHSREDRYDDKYEHSREDRYDNNRYGSDRYENDNQRNFKYRG